MNKLKLLFPAIWSVFIYSFITIMAFFGAGGAAFAEKLHVASDSGVVNFKMPQGDSAYLDIQEFAESRERAEWFNIAYQKGHELWKVDFAQTLIKYFKDENKYSQKQSHEVLTELWLPSPKYSKLSSLVEKLAHEFEGLGIRVNEQKTENHISVILDDKAAPKGPRLHFIRWGSRTRLARLTARRIPCGYIPALKTAPLKI